MTPKPDHITREAIETRIKTIETIRARWRNDPGYARTLELDLWALKVALETMK